jgi:pilus assembly protein CpaB
MRRPANILLLAIVIGAVAAALVYRYVRSQQEVMEAALNAARTTAPATTADTVPVVVAGEIIPIGTKIEPGQLKVVNWPKDAQPEGAFADPAAIGGRFTRVGIEKNLPLTQAQLVDASFGLLPMLITEGMRGMSVRVDSVTGVSGFITPNSHVDVLVAATPEGTGDKGMRSKIVLQNIKVLATGMTIEQRDNKPVEVPTVTLLVSPEDAEKLTLATRESVVQLALRNYQDEVAVVTAGATTATLFGKQEAPSPPAASPPVARVQRRREPAPGYSVEILLGDRVTRQGIF